QAHQLAQRGMPEPVDRAAFLDDGRIDADQFRRRLTDRIALPHWIAIDHFRPPSLVTRRFPATRTFGIPMGPKVGSGAFDHLYPRFWRQGHYSLIDRQRVIMAARAEP